MGNKYDDLAGQLARLQQRVAFLDDDLDRHSAVLVKLHKRLDDLERSKPKPVNEPRGDLTYVSELKCDGLEEIRWASSTKGTAWGRWYRVTAAKESPLGQAYRFIAGPNVSLHLDHAVQVRRITDGGAFIRGAA